MIGIRGNVEDGYRIVVGIDDPDKPVVAGDGDRAGTGLGTFSRWPGREGSGGGDQRGHQQTTAEDEPNNGASV